MLGIPSTFTLVLNFLVDDDDVNGGDNDDDDAKDEQEENEPVSVLGESSSDRIISVSNDDAFPGVFNLLLYELVVS